MDDELMSSRCDTVFAGLKADIMLCHLGNVSTVIVYNNKKNNGVDRIYVMLPCLAGMCAFSAHIFYCTTICREAFHCVEGLPSDDTGKNCI